MGVWLYDFNGPDTNYALTVPVDAGQPTLQGVNTSRWRRLNNRVYTDQYAGDNPILILDDGAGNADLSANVSSGGGDCLYARVSDGDNWLRLRVRKWQTSYNYTYYVTEYEWARVYTTYEYLWNLNYYHDWESRQHGGAAPSYSSFVYRQWLTTSDDYTAAAYFPDYVYGKFHEHSEGYYHEHRYRGYPSSANVWMTDSRSDSDVTGYYWTTSTSTSDPDDYRTGSTRQSPRTGTGYQTHYGLYLEKCVNGVIYNLGSVQVGAPHSLRLRVEDSGIEAYYNGSSSPVLTATDSFNSTISNHGLGRGYSDYSGTALDNLSVDTLNTPSNSPGILAPEEGAMVSSVTDLTFQWVFSDPDPGDAQTGFDLQYRPVGGAWTTVTDLSSSSDTYVLPGGTLEVATDYEWRVRTYDTAGEPGPWSPVMHFTTLAYGSVVSEGQVKPVTAMSVLVGGVKKTVSAVSVIQAGVKKAVG